MSRKTQPDLSFTDALFTVGETKARKGICSHRLSLGELYNKIHPLEHSIRLLTTLLKDNYGNVMESQLFFSYSQSTSRVTGIFEI